MENISKRQCQSGQEYASKTGSLLDGKILKNVIFPTAYVATSQVCKAFS